MFMLLPQQHTHREKNKGCVVGWSVGVGGRGGTCDDSSESFTDSNTPKCGGLAEDPKFDRFEIISPISLSGRYWMHS